jgi:hypothetical protein
MGNVRPYVVGEVAGHLVEDPESAWDERMGAGRVW